MKSLHYAGLAGLAVLALHGQAAHAQTQDYCREYTRKVVIGNTVQDAYGTACRQPDGTWKIVNQEQGDQFVEPVPPPANANVTYVVQGDEAPIYVQPRYVTYAPWVDDYAYGYPFWGYYGGGYYGGHYGGGHYDGGYYGGRGYDGGRGYGGGGGGYRH